MVLRTKRACTIKQNISSVTLIWIRMDKSLDIKKRTKLLPEIRPEVDLMRSQHIDTKAVRALTTKAVRARHQPEKGRLYKIFNTSGVWSAWSCVIAIRKKHIEYSNLQGAYTLESAFTTFFGTDKIGSSWILPVGRKKKWNNNEENLCIRVKH